MLLQKVWTNVFPSFQRKPESREFNDLVRTGFRVKPGMTPFFMAIIIYKTIEITLTGS